MSGSERRWYNLRMVVSLILSVASAFTLANYYLDFGYFGIHAKGVLFAVASIGLCYGLFLTPKKAEFREHGWWWKARS